MIYRPGTYIRATQYNLDSPTRAGISSNIVFFEADPRH